MAKGFVACNRQIMTDSVFARDFIGQFEGVLLTIPTNTESIGPTVHYTASARYHTGFQRTVVDDKTLEIRLPPRTQILLELGMQRFVHDPTLALPW